MLRKINQEENFLKCGVEWSRKQVLFSLKACLGMFHKNKKLVASKRRRQLQAALGYFSN